MLFLDEWVFSDYGNPGIKIETPKVLKRMDTNKYLPKEAAGIIKEMDLFGYGSLIDDFYLTIATTKFKKEGTVDLDKSIEGSLKALESRGVQNIIVKTEDFATQKGISGKKAYGTFIAVDKLSKKTQKMYYESLVFAQDGGLQQIFIAHKEGDEYGNKISDRVLNSVELQTAP